MKNSPIQKVTKGSAKSFQFNYDLTALPEYESYGSEMLIKSFLGLTLPRYSSLRMNLKGTTELVGFTETDVVLQDASCGWNPSGTTVQDVVEVKLCNKQSQVELCPYDLYNTYLSQYLSNENFQEQIPFAEAILEDISNRTNNQIELQLWRNSTATGGTIYNSQCFNGVTNLITTGNGATRIAYTAATPTNGLDVFTSYYQAIPENVLHRDDLVIYCGFADYRALVASMRNSSFVNLFTLDSAGSTSGEEWSLMLPGSNVRVIPTVGLDGVNAYYAGPAGYYMVGMNSEIMTVKSIYDPFEDIVKIQAHVTYGLGIFDVASFCLCK